MLKASIGTKLWMRLRREGRVLDISKVIGSGYARIFTNIIPKQMNRVELMLGFRGLAEKIYSWESFKERMIGFISLVSRPDAVSEEHIKNENVADLGATLHLGKQESKAIDDIISFTMRKAPHMLKKVKELIIQHTRYYESLNQLLPQLDRQIELESLGKLNFELDNRPLSVPTAFRKEYKKIVSDVYRRVYLNLNDLQQIPEALVQIFVDFLARCGKDFERLEEYHRSFLNEICDQTCAKLNNQLPQDFVPIESSEKPIPAMNYLGLGEEVLKSVEQELFRIVQN
jgi:hypothetical protein